MYSPVRRTSFIYVGFKNKPNCLLAGKTIIMSQYLFLFFTAYLVQLKTVVDHNCSVVSSNYYILSRFSIKQN